MIKRVSLRIFVVQACRQAGDEANKKIVFRVALKPLFPSEVYQHSDDDQNHDTQYTEVTHGPSQFGHIVKVHSINTDDKRQRHKDRGDYSKNFHDLIHAGIHRVDVNIHQAGR